MPDSSHDDLDAALRELANDTHPRRDFVARLRGELGGAPARRPAFLTWARRYAPQMALVLVLVGLVALALELTPHLLTRGPAGLPAGVPYPASQPTAVGGNPTPASGLSKLYPSALGRMGKGAILWMATAADGRLAVASSASVCLYQKDMSESWCVWPSQPAVWVGFDPSGAFLAVKLSDGTIAKLDAASGELRDSYKPFDDRQGFGASNLAWDPTGAQRMAVAEPVYAKVPAPTATSPADALSPAVHAYPPPLPTVDLSGTTKISVWDWVGHSTVWGPVSVRGGVRAVAWAKGQGGESLLAVGGENGIVLFDGATGDIRQQLDPTWQAAPMGRISTLAFSQDGAWLAYGSQNTVVALQIQGGKIDGRALRWTYWAASEPLNLTWGMAKNFAALVGNYIFIYNLDSAGSGYQSFSPAGESGLAWRTDQLAWYHTGQYGGLELLTKGENSALLSDYASSQTALVWKSDSVLMGAGRALYTWDIAKQAATLVQQTTLPDNAAPLNPLTFLAVSPDGRWAVTVGNVLFDIAAGQAVARLDPGFTNDQAVFSPDGMRVAFGGPDGRVVVYVVDTKQVDLDVQAIPAGVRLTGMAWGASLGPESDPIALTWQKADGSGGLNLLSASGIGRGQSGTVIARKNYLERPTFSADGKLLAVSDVSGQVIAWAMDKGEIRYLLDAPGTVTALGFSPDSQYLTGAPSSWGFITWGMANGQEVSRFGGQGMKINAIAFSPDGKMIASASADGTVTLWDAGAGKLPQPDEPNVTRTPLVDTPYPAPPYPGAPTQPPAGVPAPSATPTFAPPPTIAPTATLFLGTPQAQGNGVIAGQIVMGWGRHEPLAGEKIYIIDPPQPGGSTDPLAVTDGYGRFTISNIAPGRYLFAARSLNFEANVPAEGGTVDLGQIRYPLVRPPSYFAATPQPVDLARLMEGEPLPYTFLEQDTEWTPPSETEQREKIWSWAVNDMAIASQGGEGLLRAYFNRPVFVNDTRDAFTQTHPQAPNTGTFDTIQPGQDYRLLIGLWTRPDFFNAENYGPETLKNLFNRRQVEVWLMGYAMDDTPQQGAALQALRRTSDGAGGYHYTLKVHPARGFQIIRFAGNGVPDGSGVMQIHLVSDGQEINPQPPSVDTGPDDSQQADQVARDFLTYLSEGKNDPAAYDRAFDLYGRTGVVGFQGETTRAIDRLRKGCEDPDKSKRFYCLPVLQMSPAERLSADHYRVWVQLAGPDGAAWVAPNNRQQWFDFDVLRGADGRLRVVTDPPTWTGFRDIRTFMPESDLAGLDDDARVRALLEDYLVRCESPYMPDTQRLDDFMITKASSQYVVFDVIPAGSMDITFWIAAMGQVDGVWIRGKTSGVDLMKEGNFYYLRLPGNG